MSRFHPRAVTRAVAAVCGAFLLAAGAHAAGDKALYDSTKASARQTYESARQQCDALAGNTKDICVAEAKAAREKAEATAEADYKGTPKAIYDAHVDVADADYDVAKERCDDKAGNEKDVCMKEARAARDKAKADAKAERDVTRTRQEQAVDKNRAEYKAEAEKCDALSGDAKSACLNRARAEHKQ